MSTTATSNSSGVTTYTPVPANAYGTAKSGGNTLTQNDFLNLMATQLENQDPTNPQSNEDFAAQMAQFSSLTEMNDLTKTMTYVAGLDQVSSGATMLGKTVTTDVNDDSGNPISGVVTSVSLKDGGMMLVVNGKEIGMGDVTGVEPTATS